MDRMLPSGLGTPAGGAGPGRSMTPNFVEDVFQGGSLTYVTSGGVGRTIHTSGSVKVVTELGGQIVIIVNPYSGREMAIYPTAASALLRQRREYREQRLGLDELKAAIWDAVQTIVAVEERLVRDFLQSAEGRLDMIEQITESGQDLRGNATAGVGDRGEDASLRAWRSGHIQQCHPRRADSHELMKLLPLRARSVGAA